METTLRKDKRNNGKYFRKSPKGLSVTKAKKEAIRDIRVYGEYSHTYIDRESTVLTYCKYANKVILINP